MIRSILLAAVLLLLLGIGSARAGACDDPASQRQSAIVNVAGNPATVLIIPAVANQRIYLCSVFGSLLGTSPTVILLYGTKVTNDCDTGAVNLTGTMAGAGSGIVFNLGYGSDVAITPPSSQLCATVAGVGASFQGVATYVSK